MIRDLEKIIRDYFDHAQALTAVYLFGSFDDAQKKKDIAIILNNGELLFREKTRIVLDLVELINRRDVIENYADKGKSNEKFNFLIQFYINEGIPKFIKWCKDYNS